MSADHPPILNRRGFLRASAVTAGAASVAGLATPLGQPNARAAGKAATGLSLADAVLDAFQTHRLVGLGESHGLQNHHDALQLLLTHPRVSEQVDAIVIEFGNALYQSTIDRFIAGQPVNNSDLRRVWRNTTQSPQETWDEPVYEQFFRTVRAINWTLPPAKKIRVLAGDPPIDWSRIENTNELLAFVHRRDNHAASVVRDHALAKGHRTLLCYGAEHLLHSVQGNLSSILEQRTGERTYTIFDLTYTAGDPGGLAKSLASYDRNTVIPTAGTWLGRFDTGLIPPTVAVRSPDLSGRPGAGSKPKPKPRKGNPWCGMPLASLVDACLYMGQPQGLTESWWNPAIYLDPGYWTELQRRNAITEIGTDLESYRHEHPARYPTLKLPRAAECPKAQQ